MRVHGRPSDVMLGLACLLWELVRLLLEPACLLLELACFLLGLACLLLEPACFLSELACLLLELAWLCVYMCTESVVLVCASREILLVFGLGLCSLAVLCSVSWGP